MKKTPLSKSEVGSVKEPFKNTKQLYFQHLVFTFASRMFDMGITLLVADVTNNSLFYVAAGGFLSSLVSFLFMPAIGGWLDKTDRLAAIRYALVIKVIAVSLAYIFCTCLEISGDLMHRLLYALPVLLAVAYLSFSTIAQSVTKDWVVVLSDGDSDWLTRVNATLTNIDLGCASFAPAFTGFLFSIFPIGGVSIILLLTNIGAVVLPYIFVANLYSAWPGLASSASDRNAVVEATAVPAVSTAPVSAAAAASTVTGARAKQGPGSDDDAKWKKLVENLGKSDDIEENNAADANVTVVTDEENAAETGKSCCCCPSMISSSSCMSAGGSVKLFFESGCAGSMIAYSFLYLTVLSYGAIMTVYLRSTGMSDHWIGITRGLSAISGFLGALVFPLFKNKFGLFRAGQYAIVYQFSYVAVAAGVMFTSLDKSTIGWTLAISVLFSRVGLWIFDLCATQIAQEAIKEELRGRVNGTWKSLTSVMTMGSYALALVFPNPDSFWLLTSTSAVMVFLAAVTFTVTTPGFLSGICSCFLPRAGGANDAEGGAVGGNKHIRAPSDGGIEFSILAASSTHGGEGTAVEEEE